jgi:hypothetical protein
MKTISSSAEPGTRPRKTGRSSCSRRAPLTPRISSWYRFYKIPFRPKTFRINFHHQILNCVISTQIKHIKMYLSLLDNYLIFLCILQPYKVIINNLSSTKLCFTRKFWPKRFHKIDSRSTSLCRTPSPKPSSKMSALTDKRDLNTCFTTKITRFTTKITCFTSKSHVPQQICVHTHVFHNKNVYIRTYVGAIVQDKCTWMKNELKTMQMLSNVLYFDTNFMAWFCNDVPRGWHVRFSSDATSTLGLRCLRFLIHNLCQAVGTIYVNQHKVLKKTLKCKIKLVNVNTYITVLCFRWRSKIFFLKDLSCCR